MRLNITISAMFLLVGCSHIDVQKYGNIDLNDKSISVPPGSNGLKGELKKYLNSSGWRLAMNEVNTETTGKLGENVVLKQVNTYNTRYRLIVASKWHDTCMDGTDKVNFDLSVIDAKNGSEIFTMSGKHCTSDIVQSFENIILGTK